jgi:hypothetical protein
VVLPDPPLLFTITIFRMAAVEPDEQRNAIGLTVKKREQLGV